MAVFSERNDRPFITRSKLNASQRQGNYLKTLHNYVSCNKVDVKIDSLGTPRVIVGERKHGR